jgi:hypothetical protein
VKAVSDLLGVWRAEGGACGIVTPAVATDDLDLSMRAQPLGDGNVRQLRQHIDDLAPLQVQQEGSVPAGGFRQWRRVGRRSRPR